MNDSLRHLPRAGGPSDAASFVPASLSDSSNSYNGNDARRYLHEWRMAQNCYSEVTWENGQLEIRLGVSQATLCVAKEEASAVRAQLAESNATVAGKMNSMNASYSVFHCLHLDSLFVPMIVSPDSAVGISPTGGERSRGCCQCPGFLHRHPSPRYPSLYPGGCPSRRSPRRISGSNCSASLDRARSSHHGGWFLDW